MKQRKTSSKKVVVKDSPKKAAPEVQVPPVHPMYGPAVYDYNANQWTYPYAMWYGQGYGAGPGLMEQPEALVQQEPMLDTHIGTITVNSRE